jgi:hypothetical protein
MSTFGSVDEGRGEVAEENTTRPTMRMGLRPHRSPIAPTGMSRAARARV